MSKEKLLYYLLLVELTDFENISTTAQNSLVLDIVGDIGSKYRSKSALSKFLAGRLFSEQFNNLQEVERVTINKELSDKINPKLTNQTLTFEIEKKPQQITIKNVHSDKNVKYLSNAIILLNE